MMMRHNRVRARRGAVLPILAICLVSLMGFLALAIDIGMMAVARNQAQNAADGAALAGARALNGRSSMNFNVSGALAQATTTATSNSILNSPITNAQLSTLQAGIYQYNPSAGRFQAVFGAAPTGTQSYGCVQVSILTQQPTVFAKVMGVNSMTIGATATAAHRPTDVALILDFSGSMGYSSQFNYYYTQCQSLNPDANFPQFGPYSVFAGPGMVQNFSSPGSSPTNLMTYTPPTPMQRVFAYVDSNGYLYAPSNLTVSTPAGPPIVNNFLLADQVTNAFVNPGAFPSFTNVNVTGASNPTYVVTPAPATFVSDYASGFVGDPFPLAYGVALAAGSVPTPSQYAQCVADVLGISRPSATNYATVCPLWEANGYDFTYTNATKGTASTAGITGVQKPAAQRFQGFTMGPGYWGKTFYMWPPDPRTPVGTIGSAGYVAGDWRQRFFLPTAGTSQNMQDNSVFWSSSGAWNSQNLTGSPAYMIDYDAVLAWLTSGPQTLPPSLCAGRVVYYSSIPTTIPVSQSTGLISSSATPDQAFWKDYIDYVLGAGKWTNSNTMYGAQTDNSNTGAGSTLYYNNPATTGLPAQITPRSSLTGTNYTVIGATKAAPIVVTTSASLGLATGNTFTVTIAGVAGNTAANGTFTATVTGSTTFSLNGTAGNGVYTAGGTATVIPYMHYADTPVHPRMQFWFGPLSMLGYLNDPVNGNWNWHPGTCYEAQSWQLKVGINAAITDMQNNHPNNLASVIFYSGSNGYSTARVNMSVNFTDMRNCLFFPYPLLSSLSNSSSTIRPYGTGAISSSNPAGVYDTSDTVIPNAGTETGPQMGLMAAFNQFSNATDATTGVTYTGRQTASKIVIFETDGIPNMSCSGTLMGSGPAGGYYYGNIGNSSWSGDSTEINFPPKIGACAVVQQIVAPTTASPPGYSTARNPAYVHAIAFGDLFEPTSTSPETPAALQFLAAVQCYGNTSTWPGGPVPAPGTMAAWFNDSLSTATYYTGPQPYKIINGNYNTRIANIGTCIQNIMQSGIEVVLIQ
jgi:Flp pilus assembly protein TadG